MFLHKYNINMELIDITLPISNKTKTYPGDPPVELVNIGDDRYNISSLSMSLHTSTHIDAPYHIDNRGICINEMPCEVFFGRARVIDATGLDKITEDFFKGCDIRFGERLIIKTLWSENVGRDNFFTDFPPFTKLAADYLVSKGVRLIAVEQPSLAHEDDYDVHCTLLRGGVCVVEGIVNTSSLCGEVELVVLPLKIVGADGAPCRAIVFSQ